MSTRLPVEKEREKSKTMTTIIQWIYIIIGIVLVYECANWPGLEEHIASAALLSFAIAFRAELKDP